MLVLSRKQKESLVIGDRIVVTVVEVKGGKVRIAVQAPPDVPVHRREVYEKLKRLGAGGSICAPCT
jgi:carbon storage regulator